MTDFNLRSSGGGDSGPPGQNVLTISLALLAAILGTPMLFEFIGPIVRKLVLSAYGSEEFAVLMYYASFVLSGAVIFSITRITLFYALAGVAGFGALRLAGAAF